MTKAGASWSLPANPSACCCKKGSCPTYLSCQCISSLLVALILLIVQLFVIWTREWFHPKTNLGKKLTNFQTDRVLSQTHHAAIELAQEGRVGRRPSLLPVKEERRTTLVRGSITKISLTYCENSAVTLEFIPDRAGYQLGWKQNMISKILEKKK